MKKAVIFDMDGLMIDSETVTYEEYCNKLETMGLSFDIETYKLCLGKTKPGICQVFIDHFGEDFPMVEVWDDVHVAIDARLRKHVPLKKGLVELLTYLKENNYKTIVATSSDRDRVDMILGTAKLTQYFDDTICGNEVSKGKPNPEIFLTACKKLGVSEDEAVVLEDSESGILAAYDGNIDVICVPDMKYPTESFATKCTKIVDSLIDVIDYLK